MFIMHLHWIIILLCCICFDVSECCFKSGGGGGDSSSKRPTTTPQSHKIPCNPSEVRTANCRNGGQCFIVMLRNYRTTVCSCTAEWEGKQCERRYYDPDYFAVQQSSTGAIVGIVFGCLLVVILIVLVIIFIYFRCIRKTNKKPSAVNEQRHMNNNPQCEPETRLPSISENGIQPTQYPTLRSVNGYQNFHNLTMSSENTQRFSTLSAVSTNSTKQFETAL